MFISLEIIILLYFVHFFVPYPATAVAVYAVMMILRAGEDILQGGIVQRSLQNLNTCFQIRQVFYAYCKNIFWGLEAGRRPEPYVVPQG